MTLDLSKIKTLDRTWYGWKPDRPDFRDKSYVASPTVAAHLAPAHDLRPVMPMIRDQGQLGSCTGHGVRTAMMASLINENLVPKTPDGFGYDLSPLFIYFIGRLTEGQIDEDSGCAIRDVVRAVVKLGSCTEAAWPYDISKFALKPPAEDFTDALKDVVHQYQRLNQSLINMRTCIAGGYGFVFGFSVYESFESEATAKTGHMTMPRRGEQLLGGHCVFACGYDDNLVFANAGKGAMICANSWATDWGDKGYFYMPYSYIGNPRLASDFWTIRKI